MCSASYDFICFSVTLSVEFRCPERIFNQMLKIKCKYCRGPQKEGVCEENMPLSDPDGRFFSPPTYETNHKHRPLESWTCYSISFCLLVDHCLFRQNLFLVSRSIQGAFCPEKLCYTLGNICRKEERTLQTVAVHSLLHITKLWEAWVDRHPALAQEAAFSSGVVLVGLCKLGI